jgi:phosphate-selective porin OprO and OprP
MLARSKINVIYRQSTRMNWQQCITLFVVVLSLFCASAKADEPLIISAGKGGFLLTSPDGDFAIKLRGNLQVDGRFFLGDQPSAAIDTFLLRTARPIIEGTVYKYFDFRLMPDFGNGQAVIQDAYLDAKFNPAANLRFGKAKAPFGLERLQSETDLELVERSLATQLVPNRDLGIQVFGDVANARLSYQAALTNGVIDAGSSDSDNTNSKDFGARIFAKPVNGLGFGIAYSTGKQEGSLLVPALPSYKTSGQQTFFKYRLSTVIDTTTIADGTHYRYSPQFYLYHGPLGVIGEYVVSSQLLRDGLATARIDNKAWNLTANYVLTGENASYKSIDPKNPFDPSKSHWGAFEVAFRVDQLDIDHDAFPIFADPATSATKAKNWAAGFNSYLNKNIKFMFDYDHTSFEGGSLPTEKLFLTRFQIAF